MLFRHLKYLLIVGFWFFPIVDTAAQAGDVLKHLQAVSRMADRNVGSPGEKYTAEYIAAIFASLPRERHAVIGRQMFATPIRRLEAADLEIEGRKSPIQPLYANALMPEATPPDGLEGKIVYGGEGRLEDLNGKIIAGSIVLMLLESGTNWQNAARLGAKAIVYLDRGENDVARSHFRDKEELTPVNFPRFWVPLESFQKFYGNPETTEGRQAVVTSQSSWQKHLATNVYCFIPGSDEKLSEDVLLVEAFFDGSGYIPQHAPGADEAVSIATLLALAEDYATSPPKHSVLLLATTAHSNNLAGLKEAISAITGKREGIASELEKMQAAAKDRQLLADLLAAGKLGTNETQSNILIHNALQDEIRNQIEALSTKLRLARKNIAAENDQIKTLAAEKLLLRRLSWETEYARLNTADQDEIRKYLPTAVQHNEKVAKDLRDRILVLQSAMQLNELLAPKRIAAAVSLHLSSHGDGLGSLDNGFLYKLTPGLNRSKQYTYIRPVLAQAAKGNRLTYIDMLGGDGRNQWVDYFPDQPALGGEILALAGMPGFTLATLSDARSNWGTPYDTYRRVDATATLSQAAMVCGLLRALDQAALPNPPYKRVNGFATLAGRASFLRQGELFPEQTASDVLLQIYQDDRYSLAWVDGLGQFRAAGLADKKHSFGKAIIEGYRFTPGTNIAGWAIDKTITGKERYRVVMNRSLVETDLIMFACTGTTIFQLRDSRTLNPFIKINLLDARSDTDPLHYWFSRIDTKKSTLCTLFLEPDTPFKVTLSDSLLARKFLLLGNSSQDPQGHGFYAASSPMIYQTSLQAAHDMVHLVAPRVANLEKHSIVNQRIHRLLQNAQDQLHLAIEDWKQLQYSDVDLHAGASLALIARVYNDVQQTQQDVLSGVLFYIALFVPFAYCLERLLFGHVSIHRRIVSFFGILVVFVAVIYAVHPAFQLTYNPLVVILAFFIIGISILVSVILLARFELEMKNVQHLTHTAKSQSISLWQAFVAAFSIGVSNLRRRKLRTALTCTTLVILTYTLLNFTSVRSYLELGSVAYDTSAPYRGVMLKAPDWKTLPVNLSQEINRMLPGGTSITRRVWWETNDRIHLPLLSVRYQNRKTVVNGLIGLDKDEIKLTAIGRAVTDGSWLSGNSRQEMLISDTAAKQLGISTLASKPKVFLWGIEFTVCGIFDGKKYAAAGDLDGESLTPVLYPNEVSSQMSEAEADAAESGQEFVGIASRYQHLGGDECIIIPAETLLALGGSLKSVALLPGSLQVGDQLATELADRYQLLLLHGQENGTRLHFSASSLSYSGLSNVIIPSIIAVLIVLNTMIGSVMERKREIAVYTSLGLAPPHVSALFIAEAFALGIISSVLGYLAAQSAAHFLVGTSVWSGMTANYSSLAGVGAMLMVVAVVMLSVMYPSRLASQIAIPDVSRSWNLPKIVGSTMTMTLPFLIKHHEQDLVGSFLAEYYLAHQNISHGLFSTDDIAVEYACPLGESAKSQRPDCINITFRAWLAPFDFGIRQRVEIISCPSPDYPGFFEMRITLIRQAGEKNIWFRLCKGFLNDLRKQLLIWRSLDAEEKKQFAAPLEQKLYGNTAGEVML